MTFLFSLFLLHVGESGTFAQKRPFVCLFVDFFTDSIMVNHLKHLKQISVDSIKSG